MSTSKKRSDFIFRFLDYQSFLTGSILFTPNGDFNLDESQIKKYSFDDTRVDHPDTAFYEGLEMMLYTLYGGNQGFLIIKNGNQLISPESRITAEEPDIITTENRYLLTSTDYIKRSLYSENYYSSYRAILTGFNKKIVVMLAGNEEDDIENIEDIVDTEDDDIDDIKSIRGIRSIRNIRNTANTRDIVINTVLGYVEVCKWLNLNPHNHITLLKKEDDEWNPVDYRKIIMSPLEKLSKDPLYVMALKLPDSSLKNLCLSSKKHAQICNDPDFWKLKLQQIGVPEIIINRTPPVGVKRLYSDIIKNREIHNKFSHREPYYTQDADAQLVNLGDIKFMTDVFENEVNPETKAKRYTRHDISYAIKFSLWKSLAKGDIFLFYYWLDYLNPEWIRESIQSVIDQYFGGLYGLEPPNLEIFDPLLEAYESDRLTLIKRFFANHWFNTLRYYIEKYDVNPGDTINISRGFDYQFFDTFIDYYKNQIDDAKWRTVLTTLIIYGGLSDKIIAEFLSKYDRYISTENLEGILRMKEYVYISDGVINVIKETILNRQQDKF